MATTYYDTQDLYHFSSNSFPLEISVTIGDGQGGGYLIFNGTSLIGPNKKGAISAKANIKEWITVTATVKDKLQETNWTSVTVHIKDKTNQTSFGPYKREVENHLDTVCYTIKIKMIEK